MPDPTTPTVEYVVGFALDDANRVALIRKNRPAWQAGRLNGIGGHVEPGERPYDAMCREFREETGVALRGWQSFVVMDFPGARITFYRKRVPLTVLSALRTTTDEPIGLYYLGDIAGSVSTRSSPTCRGCSRSPRTPPTATSRSTSAPSSPRSSRVPELTPAQRAAGTRSWRPLEEDDPHHGGPCDCDWNDPANWTAARLRHRVLPTPDQSRYGRATTDPPPYNTDGTIRRSKP